MSANMIAEMVSTLESPCFVVDKHRVIRNCDTMRHRCEKLGVTLRPMMKTHKALEPAAIATGPSKRCLSASTVAEAEFYADGGFDDILLTLIFTQDKIKRMKSLREKLDTFHVMVDSDYGLSLLEANPVKDKKWSILFMVNVGGGRNGVEWDSPDLPVLVKKIQKSVVMDFAGIYAHDGHSYDSSDRQTVVNTGQESTNNLLQAVQSIEEAGVTVPTVGLGSTPTSSQPSGNMAKLTQLHPGNYIFYDVQQMVLGSCSLDDIAGKVLTRITGHYPERNQMLVDAGFLATSHDGHNKIPGGGSYCMVENEPNLILNKVCQEVGYITTKEGSLDFSKYPVGSILYLLPWHSCAVANLFGEYFVCEGDKVTEVWRNVHYW